VTGSGTHRHARPTGRSPPRRRSASHTVRVARIWSDRRALLRLSWRTRPAAGMPAPGTARCRGG